MLTPILGVEQVEAAVEAGAAVEEVRAGEPDERVVAGSAEELIRPAVAGQLVGSGAADDALGAGVVALPGAPSPGPALSVTAHRGRTRGVVDEVVAGAAVEPVAAVGRGRLEVAVVAVPAERGVTAVAAFEEVVALAGVQRVVAAEAAQDVRAPALPDSESLPAPPVMSSVVAVTLSCSPSSPSLATPSMLTDDARGTRGVVRAVAAAAAVDDVRAGPPSSTSPAWPPQSESSPGPPSSRARAWSGRH